MATAENTINTFQFGRELKVVPDMLTKQGAEIMLGLCTSHSVNTFDKVGPGVIGVFEKPLSSDTLKPKPIGYLVFRVGLNSIVCSMTTPLKEMVPNSALPSWVKDISEIASIGNGLQAAPMDKIEYIVKDDSGKDETKVKFIPNREYTNLGLGVLLVKQLELFAKSVGKKIISFEDVNEYAGRLLNSLGYIGKRNLNKTLE